MWLPSEKKACTSQFLYVSISDPWLATVFVCALLISLHMLLPAFDISTSMDKGPQYKFLSAGEHGCHREFPIRGSENIWTEVLFLVGSQRTASVNLSDAPERLPLTVCTWID